MQSGYAGKALKYIVLPGVMPRISRLFGSGFGMLAFLIASIYGMARLLPKGHPYLNPQNIGRFGIRHAVAEAANNLVISRRNIDQIILFGAVLLGVFLLFAQFFFLFYLMFMGSAEAGGPGTIASISLGSIFTTGAPMHDIALKMLDRVFGIPGMFGSCVDTTIHGISACKDALDNTVESPNFPWPMHKALHSLFEFYSFAMLLVGVLIFLYFVVVVTLETAVSGTPFGQRFQNIWVPIRLVVALGLLVPVHYGYNSGQYLALYAAKMGSGLATNGWLRFNDVISTGMSAGAAAGVTGMYANPTGEGKQAMIGLPKPQSVGGLVQAMSLIHTCAYTEWTFALRQLKEKGNYLSPSFYLVQPYLVKNATDGSATNPRLEFRNTDYLAALTFFNDSDIVIRFGHQNDTAFPAEPGNVSPTCGEIRIPVGSVAFKGTNIGNDYILRSYYELVKEMWFGNVLTDLPDIEAHKALKAGAVRFAENTNIDADGKIDRACYGDGESSYLPSDTPSCHEELPDARWKSEILRNYTTWINPKVKLAWDEYMKYKDDYEITDQILRYGWGGAAMWYNRVAEVNGSFMTAVLNVPVMSQYPAVMAKVLKLKEKNDASIDPESMFTPSFGTDEGGVAATDVITDQEVAKAKVLGRAYTVWVKDGSDHSTEEKQVLGNFFREAMSMILGVDGIFKMRGENAHIHPLAQLSMVGKGMVEHTIRNLAISNSMAFLGGIMGSKPGTGSITEAIGSIFSSTAFMGMTAGVTLYYIIPFLPFIYFFFAVGSWVKSVFEAMVGIPLWALAHLRLDGEGLPGDAASNGYFQILEIGLRPMLIVFGLIAAMVIFTAQVRVLNFMWDMVTANTGGFSEGTFTIALPDAEEASFKRDVMEQFGYTVIYTVIVYMLANSSFKLIDSIPNEATRWLGGGGSSFAKTDSQQNLAGQLPGYVSSGGMMQGQTVAQALQPVSAGAGQMTGEAIRGVGGGLGQIFGRG